MSQTQETSSSLPTSTPINSKSVNLILSISLGISGGLLIVWVVWYYCPQPAFINTIWIWFRSGHFTPPPIPPPPELQTNITAIAIDTTSPIIIPNNDNINIRRPEMHNNNDIELNDFHNISPQPSSTTTQTTQS